MDFESIVAEVRKRAEERRSKDPGLVAELARLDRLGTESLPATREVRLPTLDAELHLANANHNPCQIPSGARFQFLKRMILRIARLFMIRQVQFNASSVRVLNEMRIWLEALSKQQNSTSDSIHNELGALRSENSRLSAQIRSLQEEQKDLIALVRQIGIDEIHKLSGLPLSSGSITGLRNELQCADGFPNALAFLDRFRGTEEAIAKQLEKYLDEFAHLSPVVDLGCGRGEFLQLLQQKGIQAIGVDQNPRLVEYATRKGLRVVEADLFHYLNEQQNATLGGIFAAQVIEHLPGAELGTLIQLAYAKLMVGGVLVLESINPACLETFAEALYIDPTHIRPYHPLGVQFLCETAGFAEVRVDFTAPLDGTRQPLGTPFQHYAVVARR